MKVLVIIALLVVGLAVIGHYAYTEVQSTLACQPTQQPSPTCHG